MIHLIKIEVSIFEIGRMTKRESVKYTCVYICENNCDYYEIIMMTYDHIYYA